MRTNVTTSEYMYTLSEARKIINIERNIKREMLLCKIGQKLLGALSVCLGATELVLAQIATTNGTVNEGGMFLIMIPLGIYLLITRKTIIQEAK